LFLICIVCHGELARLKPAPSRLTEFYLLMSAGGALGGMCVSLVAPRVFVTFTEWPLGLIVSLAVAGFALIFGLWRVSFPWLLILTAVAGIALLLGDRIAMKVFEKASPTGHTLHLLYQSLHSAMAQNIWLGRLVDFLVFAYFVAVNIRLLRARGRNGLHLFSEAAVLAVLLPALFFLCRTTLSVEPQLERVRNFYGTMHVEEGYDTGLDNDYRTLTHGTIVHGIQNLGDLYREEPITYYGRDTGIGKALGSLNGKPDARVGVVGLGAGTVACYARAGHQFRFYEINPDVVRLARKHFTYLSDAERRGAGISTIIGDARLVLERQPAQQLDVLLLDAFSGDAIPMHLLTREAFQIYQRHMKPDGIIAVHVTNSYLMLAPVVEKQAEAMGWHTTRVITDADGDDDSTDYVLVTQNQAFLKAVPAQRPPNEPRLKLPLWTDRYHNLFQILLREEKAEPGE
ncbi:MAG TPA: fused MFS/spermidine synthase, partial [Prosthecobacter sp.]